MAEFDDEIEDIRAAWQAGQLTDAELEALLGPLAEKLAAAKATASPADDGDGEEALVKAAHEAEALAQKHPEAAVVLRLAVAVCAGVLAWKRFGK